MGDQLGGSPKSSLEVLCGPLPAGSPQEHGDRSVHGSVTPHSPGDLKAQQPTRARTRHRELCSGSELPGASVGASLADAMPGEGADTKGHVPQTSVPTTSTGLQWPQSEGGQGRDR